MDRAYIDGLEVFNNGANIGIGGGAARDSTDGVDIVLANTISSKTSGAWAAGDGNGGLFSGSIANNTWYHVFVIKKDSDGSIDAGFDTDVGALNIPAGYSHYRRIGSVKTNGSAAFLAFQQHGDEFVWSASVLDVNVTNPGTSAVTRALTVPPDVRVKAVFTSVSWDSTQNTQHICSDLAASDEAPSYANAIESASSNTTNEAVAQNRLWTDTSRQVRTRLAQSGANTAFKIRTRGWVDPRGKF